MIRAQRERPAAALRRGPLGSYQTPALLDIAGNSVAGDYPAKRTFHYQVRRALAHLAEAIGIPMTPLSTRLWAAMMRARPSYSTRIFQSVSCRAASSESEFTFNLCRDGEYAGQIHRAPIAELLDAPAFKRRLTATVGDIGAPRITAAA